jgi:hypothetical protein
MDANNRRIPPVWIGEVALQPKYRSAMLESHSVCELRCVLAEFLKETEPIAYLDHPDSAEFWIMLSKSNRRLFDSVRKEFRGQIVSLITRWRRELLDVQEQLPFKTNHRYHAVGESAADSISDRLFCGAG